MHLSPGVINAVLSIFHKLWKIWLLPKTHDKSKQVKINIKITKVFQTVRKQIILSLKITWNMKLNSNKKREQSLSPEFMHVVLHHLPHCYIIKKKNSGRGKISLHTTTSTTSD